jgi:hypothetical protein
MPGMRTACVPRCVPRASAAPTARLLAVVSLADFDRYVTEHGIPGEDYPAAIALWLAEGDGRAGAEARRWSGRRRQTVS